MAFAAAWRGLTAPPPLAVLVVAARGDGEREGRGDGACARGTVLHVLPFLRLTRRLATICEFEVFLAEWAGVKRWSPRRRGRARAQQRRAPPRARRARPGRRPRRPRRSGSRRGAATRAAAPSSSSPAAPRSPPTTTRCGLKRLHSVATAVPMAMPGVGDRALAAGVAAARVGHGLRQREVVAVDVAQRAEHRRRAGSVSRQPRLPQRQIGPPGSITVWPSSPAVPPAPTYGWPATMNPAPMPVAALT